MRWRDGIYIVFPKRYNDDEIKCLTCFTCGEQRVTIVDAQGVQSKDPISYGVLYKSKKGVPMGVAKQLLLRILEGPICR